MPARIAHLIGASVEQGRPVAIPAPAERPLSPWHPFDAWVRAPRAAAVAVLSMLGFGVLVGGAVGGSVAAPFAPLLVAIAPHTNSTPSPALNSGGGGGGGGGGGPATITETGASATPPPSAAAAAGASSSSSSSSSGGGTSNSTLPPIKHVFMVVLSDQGFNESFGHTANDPYLATTLARKGELVQNYYAVAGSPLSNEIALVSGQGPTPQTLDDCAVYSNLSPAKTGAKSQVLGTGCVYPTKTKTLASQLTAAHDTWKAYIQTSGTIAKDSQSVCRHPKIGATDSTSPSASNPYATWRNPFLYFHSLINPPSCSKEDVGLAQLSKDLKSASTTPALSYIVADVCDDGSDVPCGPSQKSGLAAADAFLQTVVPEIKRSPAYKSGLIAITFDDAPQTGPNADQSSCCDNPTYPNLAGMSTTPTTSTATTTTPTTTTGTTTTPTTPTTTGSTAATTTGTTPTTTTAATTTTVTTTTTTTTTTATTAPTTTTGTTTTSAVSLGSGETNPTGGGGQVGLLLLSPYVKPGSTDVIDYFNHFSLLASIDDLFGLKPLGYSADPSLPVFGASVYNNYNG